MKRLLWLRHETKPFEERVALCPDHVKDLLERGHDVVVEKSDARVFSDELYALAGAQMVPTNSWVTDAPEHATIFGLKELDDSDFPLIHRHIHFAHVFKNQYNAPRFFNRMSSGGGKLFDLEYLVDNNTKRVSAFGVWAGFMGAALGLELWCAQKLGLDLNQKAPLSSYKDSDTLEKYLKGELLESGGKTPRVLIIGAGGRCGRGAKDLFDRLGIKATLWGSKDTKDKSYIKEILDYDLLVNCALMNKKVKPWLTTQMLSDTSINLTTISDVSCDPTGPCNPLPVYPEATTMDRPVYYPEYNRNLAITAIDHLPSLLPKESSLDFANQLYPYLLDYMEGRLIDTPWERALGLFYKKLFSYEQDQDSDSLQSEQNLGSDSFGV